jgi:hypothetical protein
MLGEASGLSLRPSLRIHKCLGAFSVFIGIFAGNQQSNRLRAHRY